MQHRNCVVLRRQAAPDLQEVKEVKRQHCAVDKFSSTECTYDHQPLLIPHSQHLLELKEAIESENILKLQRGY